MTQSENYQHIKGTLKTQRDEGLVKFEGIRKGLGTVVKHDIIVIDYQARRVQ